MSAEIQNQEKEPAGKAVLDGLKESTGFIEDARRELTEALEVSLEHEGTSGALRAGHLVNFVKDVSKITNEDYRALVGLLNGVRNDSSKNIMFEVSEMMSKDTFSSALRRALESLREVYVSTPGSSFESFEDASLSGKSVSEVVDSGRFDEDFAGDILLLTRVAYSAGVNIVNPDWKEELPVSIPASEGVTLSIGNNGAGPKIKIEERDGVSHISYTSGSKINFDVEIADGESAIVGRKLSISDVLGLEIHDLEVRVEGQLPSGLNTWSRGALLILRKDGEIFLFDRGSRNEIRIDQSQGEEIHRSGVYSPGERQLADGSWSYGDSVFDVELPPLSE